MAEHVLDVDKAPVRFRAGPYIKFKKLKELSRIMRLLNILIGLGLLFLSTNKFFNYSDFSISDSILGIFLIVWGIIIILSSISFQSTFRSEPGRSVETSSMGAKGKKVFLGILSIFIGILNVGILDLGIPPFIGTAILGILFLISK